MIIPYILVSLSLIVPIEGFQTYFTAGETRKWDLQKLFNGIDDPQYDVNDIAFSFAIQNPISDFGVPRNHIKAAKKVIASKPMVSRIGHYWLNHFLFLDLDGWNINLFYSESPQDENQATPYFGETIKLVEQVDKQEEELTRCFDGDYISEKLFIIDCQKKASTTDFQDLFYFVNKDGTKTEFSQLTTKTNFDQKRILRMYETETTHYAFRGVCGKDSVISSFEIVNNEPKYGKVNLNQILLQQLFNLDNTFKFEMIDFQVNYLGHVYILDKTALFVCQFNENGEWNKINMYKFMTYTPYGFDLNEVITDDGLKLNILAILFDKSFNLYINTDKDGKRYQIPITITEQPASIQISMNYIIVQYSKTNYLYSIESTNLLFKLTQEDGTQYLCNPHYPDYISISTTRSNRYLISNGLLRFLESAKLVSQQNVQIKAFSLSDPTKKYEINMPYSIIEATDEALKQTNEWQVFTEPISMKDQKQLIEPFVSGPNIQYVNLDDKSGIDIEFNSVVQLTIPQQWPNPSDIVFQDMLQFDESRNYFIFQLKNLEIQIWECRIGKSTLLDECQLDKKITTIKPQIDKYHFQWWIGENAVHIAYCDSEMTFQVWKLVGSDISMEVKVILTTPITQILHLQKQLYIVQKDSSQLRVYEATGEFQQIETIDDVYVKKLGFKKSWSPLKIWGNPKFMSHLIFIRNKNNILLIKFTNELVLVKSIDVKIEYEAEITIYTESFFLIKPDEIKEYNFQDLSDIYVMKVVPLYGFKLNMPLTFTQSDENGLLFISAKITEKQFIVVYQPDSLSHDSQLRQIEQKTLPKQLSACGFQHTYFYFNDGQSHQYSVVYRKVELKANANIKSDFYYVEVTKSLQIKNQLSVFNFKDLVGVVNTMSQIYTDDKYVPQQIEVEKKATVQQLSLGNMWYHGQVIDFKITCDQCPKQINILNPINSINKNAFSKYQVKDIDNYDDLNQVFQLTDSIILVDQDNNIRAEISYDQPNSCQLIQSHPSQNLILSICQYNNIYHAYLVTCTAKFKCNTVDKPIDLPNIQSVTKFRFLDDNIILLSSLSNLYVYHLTYSKDTWNIILKDKLEIGLNDFDIQPYTENQKNYYLISIVDKSDNLVFMNAQVNNQEFKELSTSSMPLYEIITIEKQFAFKTTDYLFVQSLSKITFNSQGLIQIPLLIITNNVAHYQIQFTLTADKLVQRHTITNVFNQYSNWKTISKFAFHKDKFAIVYTNDDKYLGVVYQIPKMVSNGVATSTFLGGIKGQFNNKLGPLVLYLFERLSQTILYSNLQSATDKLDIQTYQVYDSPQLAFIDGLNLNYQQILTIQAENDLSNAKITTTLKEIIDNVIEKKSSNLWWILLLTFSLLAVAAALGWFLWKRKKQRDYQEKKDFSLLNMQNDV